MKNLLLIPLLLNTTPTQPLNENSVGRDGNSLTIRTYYNDTEYTPFTDNLQYLNNIQDYEYGWETTQKFATDTGINTAQYANIQMYNYTYSYYAQSDIDGAKYESTCFFIQAITPYKTLYQNTMDFTATFKYNEQMALILQVATTLYETTENLNQYLNANNWTTLTAIQNMINQTMAIQNKTELISQTTQFRDGNLGVNEGQTTMNATITIDPTKTNFIFGQLKLTTIRQQEQIMQNWTPTPTNKGVHISETTLHSMIAQVPTQEIVDIPGLMFTILGLPFSFISQAFDLTIFPGTPYQVNFANIFLGFIGIAMFLWILKVIMGQADLGQWLGDHKRMHREERLRDKQHKENMARETARHNRQLQRDATHDLNRHRELQAKEKADHTRAMQHKGKR